MDEATKPVARTDPQPEQPPRANVLDYSGPGQRTARRLRPPVLRIAAIGIVLLPLLLLIAYSVAPILPFGVESHAFVEIPTTRPGRYGGNAAFHINASGSGRGSWGRMEHAYVVYDGEGFGQINVNFLTMTHNYNYRPPWVPLTTQAVATYMVQSGFDPALAETASLANSLVAELQKLAAGQLPPEVTGRSYPLPVPSIHYSVKGFSFLNLGEYGYLLWLPWYTVYCVAVWLVLWLLSARWLLRRYRRRIANAAG